MGAFDAIDSTVSGALAPISPSALARKGARISFSISGNERSSDRSLADLSQTLQEVASSLSRLRQAVCGNLGGDRRDVINASAAARYLEHTHWEWKETRCSRHPRLHGQVVQALAFLAGSMPRLRLAMNTGDQGALAEALGAIEAVEDRLTVLERELERAQIAERLESIRRLSGGSA